MGIYAWAAPGLASFGANGSLVGTSSGASLATNITTTNPNSITLTILARQAISGNPVEVDTYANSTTVMIQNGYSGLQENTNSALFSLAYQLSPSTGAYSETITFGDTRASGAIMTELVGAA